jgi:hypothetical protein
MDFLHTKDLVISVNPTGQPIGNEKELEIKINNINRLYKGILPKKLKIHGYKKYNLEEQLIKYIFESNVLNVDYNDFDGLMYLYISDLEFDDGKKYSSKITIKMKRYFNIDANIDEIQDIEILRKRLKTSADYIKVLENKIFKLEEENDELKEYSNQYDNYSDF